MDLKNPFRIKYIDRVYESSKFCGEMTAKIRRLRLLLRPSPRVMGAADGRSTNFEEFNDDGHGQACQQSN